MIDDDKRQVHGAGEIANLTGSAPPADALGVPSQYETVPPVVGTGAYVKIGEAIQQHVRYLKTAQYVDKPAYLSDGDFDLPMSICTEIARNAFAVRVRKVLGNTLFDGINYNAPDIRVAALLPVCEKEFGPYFFQTDLAINAGIDPAKPDELIELDKMKDMWKYAALLEEWVKPSEHPVNYNPFLVLLLMDREKRGFLEGLLDFSMTEIGIVIDVNTNADTGQLMGIVKGAITLERLVRYGETVGENELQQYWDEVKNLAI